MTPFLISIASLVDLVSRSRLSILRVFLAAVTPFGCNKNPRTWRGGKFSPDVRIRRAGLTLLRCVFRILGPP